LAQAFEIDATGITSHYSIATSDAELLAHEDRIKGMLDKKIYDHRAIFFGSQGGNDYPPWFGYSFGYALANAWLKYSGRTAADAVHVEAKEILLPWLEGKFSIVGDSPTPPDNRRGDIGQRLLQQFSRA
jgi:uncharacterized protein YjaZ